MRSRSSGLPRADSSVQIHLEDVHRSYPIGEGLLPALRGVSLEIGVKDRIALLGANGCGKSSLLHILDGLAFPQKGEVLFLGQRLSEEALSDAEFNSFFRKFLSVKIMTSSISSVIVATWVRSLIRPVCIIKDSFHFTYKVRCCFF